MGTELTKQQNEILDFIIEFDEKFGYQPAPQEIADAFGMKSTRSVVDHINALKRKGYLNDEPGKARSIVMGHNKAQLPQSIDYTQILQNHQTHHAQQTVERFTAHYGQNYKLLAQFCALPLVLTPELVNYLRNQFLREHNIPWVAEVDLLLSELCQPVGYETYAMDTAVRVYLLNDMKADPVLRPKMQEAARLLIHYVKQLAHTNPFAGMHEFEAQQWAAMVYLDDKRDQAVKEIAKSYQVVLHDSDRSDVSKNLKSVSKLAHLNKIVDKMKTELQSQDKYSELISFAEEVASFIQNREIDLNKLKNRSVLGINLVPDMYSPRKWTQTIQNPYMVGRPIWVSDLFVGRLDVISFVRDNIRVKGSTTNPNILCLYGERRLGKTSVLYRIMDTIDPEDLSWVFVDLQGIVDGNQTIPIFFYRISRKIALTAKRESIQKTDYPDIASFEISWKSAFNGFCNKLKRSFGKPIVIILDEFGSILSSFTELDVGEVLNYLSNMTKKLELGLIISCRYETLEQLRSSYSSFYNLITKYKITYLTEQETYSLIVEPIKNEITYSREALKLIWQLTAGHPYFIQSICRKIITRLNENEIAYVTYDEVHMVDFGHENMLLEYIFRSLEEEEQHVLEIICRLTNSSTSSYPTLEDIFKNTNLSHSVLKSIIDRLESQDIILEKKNGVSIYRIKMGLMEIWLSSKGSL